MPATIVICAYNRPHALARLLRSLDRGLYPGGDVRVVISLDRGPAGVDPAVRAVAEAWTWPHGPKDVILQPARLGLVQHVFFCGDLTQTLGDVIFLEDDQIASPVCYPYAVQALDFYRADERVAGLCLYALWFNGYTQQPFVPLADGADAFFLGVPCTLGQAFTAAQWRAFREWLAVQPEPPARDDRVHPAFYTFDTEDWYPLTARYAGATGRVTVYPRVSLTSGAGDAGTHFAAPTPFLEAPLDRGRTEFRFKPLDEADAVYDAFFELRPDRLNRLTEALRGWDYAVDLYATKTLAQLRQAEYVLTSRPTRRAVLTFGLTRWPWEANIIEGVPGDALSLCRPADLRWDAWAEWVTRQRLHAYFTRGRRLSRRQALQFQLVEWLKRGR